MRRFDAHNADKIVWHTKLVILIAAGNITVMILIIAGKCGRGSPCEQLCYELHDGMYECDCMVGFELREDGYSCYGKWIYLSTHQTEKENLI